LFAECEVARAKFYAKEITAEEYIKVRKARDAACDAWTAA
jgi:hypothetical protein